MPEYKNFKINIYGVEVARGNTPFEDGILAACALDAPQRERVISGRRRRIEECDQRAEGILENFTVFRFPGPGRVAEGGVANAMGLDPNEFYSHDTAMLYDPETRLAFLESAQGGMGATATKEYLQQFTNDETVYQLVPRTDDDVAARARLFQVVRKVRVRLDLGPPTETDHRAGLNVFQDLGDEYEGGYIEVIVSARRERNHSLSIGRIWDMLNPILGNRADSSATVLEVSGKEDEEDPTQLIDLFQHRERRVRELIVGDNRKIDHLTRWEALVEIRNEFVG